MTCILSTTHLAARPFARARSPSRSAVACRELNLRARTSSTNAAEDPQLEGLDPMHAERSFTFQPATALIASFALLVASPTPGTAQTVGVFTVAAAASAVGIAGYDNYKPPLSQQQTAVIQTAQQTARSRKRRSSMPSGPLRRSPKSNPS
jgi:hypothetical protein